MSKVDEKDVKAKSLGAIKKISFEDGKVIYLKKPHRQVLGLAFAKLDVNPVEANEMLINNSVVRECSDMEILEDDNYFLSVMQHVGSLLELKKSTSSTL